MKSQSLDPVQPIYSSLFLLDNPPRLCEVQPLAMVDLSVRCFPHILPWEVAIACGIDQSNEDMVSHDPQQLVTMATSATPSQAPERVTFGKFLSQCLQDEQTNPATMEVFQSDPDLMMLSLSVLLQLGPSKTCLQTPDGNPAYVGHIEPPNQSCNSSSPVPRHVGRAEHCVCNPLIRVVRSEGFCGYTIHKTM